MYPVIHIGYTYDSVLFRWLEFQLHVCPRPDSSTRPELRDNSDDDGNVVDNECEESLNLGWSSSSSPAVWAGTLI